MVLPLAVKGREHRPCLNLVWLWLWEKCGFMALVEVMCKVSTGVTVSSMEKGVGDRQDPGARTVPTCDVQSAVLGAVVAAI